MRKAKIITIEGLGEVTVKEVTPFAVYQAMTAENKVQEVMALATNCVVLPGEKKLQELYPSEIEQIIDIFMEVNSSFLSIAEKLAVKTLLKEIASEAAKILQQLFADSYKEVMAEMLGTMAGAASLSPSKP